MRPFFVNGCNGNDKIHSSGYHHYVCYIIIVSTTILTDNCLVGLKLLNSDGITDMEAASALSHARDIVDVYSNSWGPTDNGFSVGAPRTLTKLALKEGTSTVRDVYNHVAHCSISFLIGTKWKGIYIRIC